MNISELPTYDDFAQCVIKLHKQSEEYVEKRKEEMCNCNHLFVLLEEGEWIPGFHSSDYEWVQNRVECVHCGLTNKFKAFEELFDSPTVGHIWAMPGRGYYKKTLETEMFHQIFQNAYHRSGKSFNESVINLISKEELKTSHPGLLYQLALKINNQASNEELFEIMKELHNLETRQENLRLRTVEQAEDLLIRYQNTKKVKLKELSTR